MAHPSAFSPFNDHVTSPVGSRHGPSPSSSQFGAGGTPLAAARPSMDGSDYNSPSSFFNSNPFGNTPAVNDTDTGDGQRKSMSKDDESEATPAWADLKTKAGKERKRLPLACITCRRKKIRCSGEKPACKHCMRSRIPCVYKITTRKAAPRTDYMAMLDKRLKRMEERVIKIMPKDDHRNLDVIGRAVVKPALPGTATKPEPRKRAADEAFEDELDGWSKSKGTGNGAKANAKLDEQALEDVMVEGAEHLPSPAIQHHLAEVFFEYAYGQAYHLLHKPSYMRKLEADQLPPVLVLSVCCVAARFSTHPDLRTEPVFLRGEQWAKAAREIALKRYDAPNITILICYLLLGLHEFGTCQGGRSWMLGGMAQRMAYALQLHKDLDHTPPSGKLDEKSDLTSTDREIRRRTMWACFIMDRFNSSGTDRPMFVADSYIEAQLPIKEHYFQMEINGPTETLEGTTSKAVALDSGQPTDPKDNMGVAAYLIRAIAIWGNVVRYINLGGRDKDPLPMWSEESGFSKLKASAAEFKANLPAKLLWDDANLQSHVADTTANQFVFLHIVMHQITLFMNRFALPVVGSRSASTGEMPSAFLSECARSALDAASQISTLVNLAHEHRVVAPFAGYSAFLSSTVHIHGLSSKNPAIEASSKQYLAWNVKYLSKMKKYWGMFHFVTEHLKDLYRRQMDANSRAQRGIITPSGAKANEEIFQYGDWFNRYPHGVSGTDYEEGRTDTKKEAGADALFGQKADLQSVEEFFQKLPPQDRSAQARKASKKKGSKSAGSANQAAAEDADETVSPSLQQIQPKQSVSQTNTALQPGQFDYSATGQSFNGDQAALLSSQQLGSSQTLYDTTGMQNELAMMQAQPGLMSQLDRQMVLNSYGNTVDLNTWADQDMTLHAFGDMQNLPQQNNNPSMDPIWNDPGSLSWFMPFNVDLPNNISADDGLFGGQYDFGPLLGDAELGLDAMTGLEGGGGGGEANEGS